MVETENLSSLLSSSALILVGTVLTSVFTLTERVVVARLFDPGAYGEVAIALAVLSIGTTVSLVGLNHGIPRYVSRYEDPRDVRGTWLTGLVGATVVSIGITTVLFLAADTVIDLVGDESTSRTVLRLLVLVIPIEVSVTVGVATLRGLENTRYKLYVKNLFHPGLRLLLIAVFLAGGMGLAGVGYAYLLAGLAAVVVTHVLANRLVPLLGPVRFHVRELVCYSAPLVLTMVLSVVLTQTDTLMLGYFTTTTAVGVYNAAYPLANSLLLVTSAFGYLYLPLTSRLDANENRDEVADIYQITTKWGFVVTFPAFLAVTVFASDFVTMFFGADYERGGIALAILSVGFFTSAAFGRNRSTLSALGHTTHILAADVVTIVMNVALNILLIPAYSFVGAAVASATAYLVRNCAIHAVLRFKCGMSPFSGPVLRIYALLPATLFPVTLLLSGWMTLTPVTLLPFLVVTGLACIALVTVSGCLQPADAVVLDLIEEYVGVDVPPIRRRIPARD